MKDYNFFSIYNKKKLTINPKSPSFIIFVSIIFALLCCGGIYFLNYTINRNLTDTYAELNEKRNDPNYAEVNQLHNELQALDKYSTMADKVIGKYNEADTIKSSFFIDFAKVIPQKIKLTSVNLSGSAIQIQCSAPDRKSVAELISDMNESGIFQSIFLLSVTAKSDQNTGSTDYTATLQAIVKEGEAE